MKHSLFVWAGMLLTTGLNAPVFAAEDPRLSDMMHEILRLNKLLEDAQAKLKKYQGEEAMGQPINLGRTSLAALNCSSVNGSRGLANKYYGIPNAFDDGQNKLGDMTYTYWLASYETVPWAEVSFDVPVAITSISVDGGTPFSTQMFTSLGAEWDEPESNSQLVLAEPRRSVSKVRLNFRGGGRFQVNEIRILGTVPPGVKYEVMTPRVLMTKENARDITREFFYQWQQNLGACGEPEITEDGDQLIATYYHLNPRFPMFRTVMNRKTGEIKSEGLADVAPLK